MAKSWKEIYESKRKGKFRTDFAETVRQRFLFSARLRARSWNLRGENFSKICDLRVTLSYFWRKVTKTSVLQHGIVILYPELENSAGFRRNMAKMREVRRGFHGSSRGKERIPRYFDKVLNKEQVFCCAGFYPTKNKNSTIFRRNAILYFAETKRISEYFTETVSWKILRCLKEKCVLRKARNSVEWHNFVKQKIV